MGPRHFDSRSTKVAHQRDEDGTADALHEQSIGCIPDDLACDGVETRLDEGMIERYQRLEAASGFAVRRPQNLQRRCRRSRDACLRSSRDEAERIFPEELTRRTSFELDSHGASLGVHQRQHNAMMGMTPLDLA